MAQNSESTLSSPITPSSPITFIAISMLPDITPIHTGNNTSTIITIPQQSTVQTIPVNATSGNTPIDNTTSTNTPTVIISPTNSTPLTSSTTTLENTLFDKPQRICVEQWVSPGDPLKFCYNIKWSNDDNSKDHFKISTLGKTGTIHKNTGKFNPTFVLHLKKLFWTEIAIIRLRYIVLSRHETTYLTLNCETGRVKDERLSMR